MSEKPLPSYVAINDETLSPETRNILRTPAKEITFPLSPEVEEMLRLLVAKYDQEENCAGLAAPQLGFPIKAFVFGVMADEELKKWRPDLEDTMPKSLWINPSYRPVGEESRRDYEGCFSVKGLASEVSRYTHIAYEAYTKEGQKITGEARGFLARVIQHETDHVNGTLCIDRAVPGSVMSVEAYREKRRQAQEGISKREIKGTKVVESR